MSIRDSVRDVQVSLLLALVLVVVVIFVFLRNVSATIIPSLALPMSIVGTFAVMYVFGYSLDNLSLMALTLCVGFVVDDAIVMLENITRHMEMGKSRMQATLDGSKEIGFTIVSMTISLVAVFIPVLFMGGILGRLLHEFAVTIIVAVLISGFVSLTLTPMLCSRMLVDEHEKKHGRVYAFSERMFDAVLGRLPARRWRWVLQHQRLTLAAFFGDHRRDRRAVRHDAEGLPADRRLRPDPRLHRGGAGRLVRGDGEHAAAGRRDRQGESRTSRARCPRSAPAARARRSTSAASSSR